MIAHILRLALVLTLLAGGFFGHWLVPKGPWSWPATAFFALLFVPLSHALGLIPGFALAEFSDQDADHRHSRSGPSALWRAYYTEAIASTWVFCGLQALRHWRGTDAAHEQASHRASLAPVVLVHGYFCNRTMWLPLVRYWQRHPISALRHVDGVTLTPPFEGLDRYADQVHRHVLQAQRKSGRRVVLVAHSMGGLVVRAYLRKYSAERIKGVITLGSPHQGTVTADYGHGMSVRQMRLGNSWLDDLATHERLHPMPAFEVILSMHDNMVAPRHMQTIPCANTQIVEGIGHMGLAQNRDIWRLIDNILQRWDSK